jgi:hypothetical protein
MDESEICYRPLGIAKCRQFVFDRIESVPVEDDDIDPEREREIVMSFQDVVIAFQSQVPSLTAVQQSLKCLYDEFQKWAPSGDFLRNAGILDFLFDALMGEFGSQTTNQILTLIDYLLVYRGPSILDFAFGDRLAQIILKLLTGIQPSWLKQQRSIISGVYLATKIAKSAAFFSESFCLTLHETGYFILSQDILRITQPIPETNDFETRCYISKIRSVIFETYFIWIRWNKTLPADVLDVLSHSFASETGAGLSELSNTVLATLQRFSPIVTRLKNTAFFSDLWQYGICRLKIPEAADIFTESICIDSSVANFVERDFLLPFVCDLWRSLLTSDSKSDELLFECFIQMLANSLIFQESEISHSEREMFEFFFVTAKELVNSTLLFTKEVVIFFLAVLVKKSGFEYSSLAVESGVLALILEHCADTDNETLSDMGNKIAEKFELWVNH